MRFTMFLLILTACGAEVETDLDSSFVPPTPASIGDMAGDGACTGNETAATTPDDCPAFRGDGFCTHDETPATAASDCRDQRGDGLCTGNENPANTPEDCRTVAGDGLCTGNETPANSSDCHSVVGDGMCTGDETAATAPADCPAAPGDGQCTGGENAANTPQDCPAILGDGHCTHNETPASALADCPPPDLVFTGGSLAGLRSVSPSLYFGELTITGPLSLTPSDNEVVLHVESFTLPASGWINATWSTCEYSASPSLTVIATGTVRIDGGIGLGGRSGVRTTASATCNTCYGKNGGDLTIAGDTIDIRGSLRTNGGRGSQSVDPDYTLGCDAGDAGDVILTASRRLDIDAEVAMDGGNGGIGSAGWPGGDDGAAGATFWDAPVVAVVERESNGIVDLAQALPLSPLTVHASISATDDIDKAGHSAARQVVFPDHIDRIEDLYFVTNHGAGSATFVIELDTDNSVTDLDLYLIDEAGGTIVAQSNEPGGSESVTVVVAAGASHYIGVSHCAGSPASAYTLTLR